MENFEEKPLWRVIYVHPRTEKKVAKYCQIGNITFYLPLRTEKKIYQRRKVIVEKPVFPGYIFARLDGEGKITILKSNHIVRIMDTPNQRLLLHQLAQIRKALRANPALTAEPALTKGIKVRITNGPFIGIEGIVTSLKGINRVLLNVDIVGQAVGVEVERNFLEIIG